MRFSHALILESDSAGDVLVDLSRIRLKPQSLNM